RQVRQFFQSTHSSQSRYDRYNRYNRYNRYRASIADGRRGSKVGPDNLSIGEARHNMLPLQQLWQDESGVVLSAEVVTVGTLGVLGAVVGLNAAGTAIDGELKEFSSAIRSLDQSYCVSGHRSCRAWTAGSCYRQ